MKGPLTTFTEVVLSAWLLAPAAAHYHRPTSADDNPSVSRRFVVTKSKGWQTEVDKPLLQGRPVEYLIEDRIADLYDRLAALCRARLEGSQPEQAFLAEMENVRTELVRLQHEEADRERRVADSARPFTRGQVSRVLNELRASTRRDENTSSGPATPTENQPDA